MRNAVQLAVLFAVLALARADARQVDFRPTSTSREYVRLQDWAALNKLQIRWLERDKTLQLSNQFSRIKLTINSVAAEINGVSVRLCFPVSIQNGSVTVAQVDLQRTLGPVLYPSVSKAGSKIKTICIDPGHGGNDTGEHVGGVQEKKYTLLLARELQEQLTRAGFRVLMTRTADVRVELPDRAEFARRRKADLFLSLHFNSLPAGPDRNDVKGIETYCLTPAGAFSSNAQGEGDTRWVRANANDEKNMLLAYQVQKSLIHELAAEDRSVKRARFQVLREVSMPAVLVEGGFLSHPSEQRKILDTNYRRSLAKAIVDGILAYKKIVKG